MRIFALIVLSVSLARAGTITVTNPQPWFVSQRNIVGRAPILIQGTVSGGTYSVEASWNSGAYQTVATGATADFSGTLTNQLQGRGTLTVRLVEEPATTAVVTNIGVGDRYVIAGQSNASGRGNSDQSYGAETNYASMFGNDYTWQRLADKTDATNSQVDTVSQETVAVGGSVWPLLGSFIVTNQPVPVAFIPCAKGSSDIADWFPGASHTNRATLYGSMIWRATNHLVSGGVKGVLWWQGESEASTGASSNYYYTSIVAVASAVMSDLGVKLIPCVLQNSTGIVDNAEALINDAIRAAWTNEPTIISRGPDLSGIDSDDDFHLKTTAKLQQAAGLWWNALSETIYPARTIAANSGSSTDVGLAVYSTADGDTVNIPAGTNFWPSHVGITNRSVNLRGAGIGQTIITDGASQTGTTASALKIASLGTNEVWISDITWYQDAASNSWSVIAGARSEPSVGRWIVTQCEFRSIQTRGVGALGFSGALISTNYFQALTDGTQQGITVRGPGTTNWTYGTTWSSLDRLYVENNIFDFAGPADSAIELYFGAEATVRFNFFTNCTSGMHGLDSGSWAAGGSAKDRIFYGNIFHHNVSATIPLNNRGGSSLSFSNRWIRSGAYVETPQIVLQAYRSRTDPDLCSSFAQGCATGSNVVDGNIITTNGWPVAQAPGTTGPFIGDGTTTNSLGVLTHTEWNLAPCYEWENYYGASLESATNDVQHAVNNAQNDVLVNGRDYTNDTALAGLILAPYPYPLTSGAGAASGGVTITGGGVTITGAGVTLSAE